MTEERNSLPELPVGWVWTTIGEVTQPIEKVMPKENPDTQFTYLDISSIDNQLNKVVEPKIYSGSEAPSRARQLVRAHDVLFSTVRTYLKNIALVPEIYNGQIASTGFSVLRGESDISPKYLFYYSLTDQFINPLSKLQRGTSYPAVRDSDVRAQPIPLPPLPEQHRIVAKIEELFTQLDAGVAALEKAKAQLRRYRQAVLKAAVEGELTREWREAHARELQPASIDADDEPLPQGWTWAKIGKICETTSGGTPSRKQPSYFGGDIPWLKSGELENELVRRAEEFITEEGLNNSSAKIIPKGTLLVALYGATVGKLGILGIDAAINQAICAVFTPPELDSKYLFWFLLQYRNELLNARIGGAQPNISQRILKRVQIPLPPLAEQRRIVEEVEQRLSVTDEMEKAVEQSLKRAERLRQSILKRAFEGKLVPQDPSDEPASVLLERIRVEKARREGEGKGRRKGIRRKRRKTEKAQQLKML